MSVTLGDIAKRTGSKVKGDSSLVISGIAAPDKAEEGDLCFVMHKKLLPLLATTRASAAIVSPAGEEYFSGNRLIHNNPYYVYAVASQFFSPYPSPTTEVHPTAAIDKTVQLGRNVSIAPQAVIEGNVDIGDNCQIGSGVFIGANSKIGAETCIRANAVIHTATVIGKRCIVHSGAVIGDDGFGFAPNKGEWERIAQIGNVVMGDDVDVGSNTTIDRAALSSTLIGNGVKIDNLVQIAHNVIIGDNTAIAACTGIAGSTTIGKDCKIAGGVGLTGHLEVADGVTITAMSLVQHSLKEPGASYSSGTTTVETARWRRNTIRFNHLDQMAKTIKELQDQLNQLIEK